MPRREKSMSTYRHILVPTDGSALSLEGAKQAVALASDLHAKLTAIYVAPPWNMPYSDASTTASSFEQAKRAYEEESELNARRALDQVDALAKAADVKCDGLALTDGRPWESIINAAQTQDCDLIVMASHGRGHLGALLLGSQTSQVLTHSKTPVLVCR
jgi:nucleotide-binding universal stress UspA family protein